MQGSHAVRRVAWSILLAAAAACSRAPQPAAPDATDPAPAADAGEDTLPWESSLAMKRGVITLGEDRSTFVPCQAEQELWVLDQSPNQITQSLIEEEQTAPVSMYIEAYGERAPAQDVPEAAGFDGVFVLEEILYASVVNDTRGCDEADAAYVVHARGNEPFWSIEVRDAEMVFHQPEGPQEIVFHDPQTVNAEGAVQYDARTAQHRIELMVYTQPCRDSMSGEYFAFTARAVLDGRELNGCARVGR
ncbi:MAG: hypothetical protein C0P74_003825 [Gammaproteobacteria bacterium]|nr:hypothetical protein [Gammaproteobacteria bacterium]